MVQQSKISNEQLRIISIFVCQNSILMKVIICFFSDQQPQNDFPMINLIIKIFFSDQLIVNSSSPISIFFIMFSCFGKKNRIQKAQHKPQKRFSIRCPSDSTSSINTSRSTSSTPQILQQTKIYQQEGPTQPCTAKLPIESVETDSIVKIQIQDMQLQSPCSYTTILCLQATFKPSQVLGIKPSNKFSEIYNEDQLQVVRQTISEVVLHRDEQSCNITVEDCMYQEHNTPRQLESFTHTFRKIQNQDNNEVISDEIKSNNRRHKHRHRRSKTRENSKIQSLMPYDPAFEQQAINTTISLPNFHKEIQKIQSKIQEQLDDLSLNETYQQAENSFYCLGADIGEQFTRAVISNSTIDLAKTIYAKMTASDKNKKDFKGYAPVHLLILKGLQNQKFIELAKHAIYDAEVSLECKGPSGWNPLQDALYYRNIPLVTHIFKAAYSKKQQTYKRALTRISQFLFTIPDFSLTIDVKVDSFLPLIGNFTPSDTLNIRKMGNQVKLDYSLVGYQFFSCKRRQMSVFFNGESLLGLNNSKQIYCDLLDPLEHQQMVLLVEDMLCSEIKRGEQIVHEVSITKPLSIFQNEITEEIGDNQATKYNLNLCYTSTAEKRLPSTADKNQMLNFMNDYTLFTDRHQEIAIKEKNKNKKIQLELWLGKGFGLQLTELISIFELLGMGNNIVAEWEKFLKQTVASKIEQSGLFPLRIDIPLNYSLFFNMQFKNFNPLQKDSEPITFPSSLKKVSRKQFQGTLESRQKRALYLQAYT